MIALSLVAMSRSPRGPEQVRPAIARPHTKRIRRMLRPITIAIVRSRPDKISAADRVCCGDRRTCVMRSESKTFLKIVAGCLAAAALWGCNRSVVGGPGDGGADRDPEVGQSDSDGPND